MRLVSFRTKNFKSIIDTGFCSIDSEDNILVLAGQNEAGKSAVIESLNFFRNGPSKTFEALHRRQEMSPEVSCVFVFDDAEIQEIFSDFGSTNLISFLKKNNEITFVRGSSEEDNFGTIKLSDEVKEKLREAFPALDDMVPPDDNAISDKTKAEVPTSDEVTEPPTADETTEEEGPEEELAEAIDSIEEVLVKSLNKFIFYDSFTDLLPGEVFIVDIPKHPAVLDFQKVFNIDFAETIKKGPRAIKFEENRIEKEASMNLNTYWKQKLEDGDEYNFSVKITAGADATTSKVEFYIERGDNDPLHFLQKSKGFQWFSAFNLRLRALGVDKAQIKKLVILIDEPGQGLHEKAQEDVKNVLEELAENGAQIIYTTHYPMLIDTESSKFARIRLVSNTTKTGTLVQTPAQYASGSGSMDALSPIVTSMGMHSVGSLVDKNRLSVVVEGITDHYYMTAFKKLLNKDNDLYFLPACGVTNVPNLISVLIGWRCPYVAVFDDDKSSGRRIFKTLQKEFFENSEEMAHEYIHRLKGCNGIEDIFTKTDFMKLVLTDGAVDKSADNSAVADGKKEILARIFMQKVNKGDITKEDLSKGTIDNIVKVFDWIEKTFSERS